MTLTRLALKNFRSYRKTTFDFSSRITIIIGPNTAGKTNILEAIFLIATGKSFRAETDREMIGQGNKLARIKCHLGFSTVMPNLIRHPQHDEKEILNQVQDDKMELEITLTTGEVGGQRVPIKRYLVNAVARRQIDFVGNLRVVLFWPEDLELVTDSPSLRRRYLDFVLMQVDREYRRSLLSYEKGLRQRNKLLEKIREGEAARGQLLFWDQLLIKTGNYLTSARETYLGAVNVARKPFGAYHLEYDHSYISETRLQEYADAEVAAAATLVGPHRDDIRFFEGERDLARFGSRGEQRLAILWLKLAELEFIAVRTDEPPVLLLDDIFSELDHGHRDEVVKIMGLQQTILTTTDRHFLPESLVTAAEVIELGK